MMRLTASSLAPSSGGEEAIALTTGWVMGYSPEYAALEGDPNYLAMLAELGGGVVLEEEPAKAFAHTLRGEGATRDLWPYLLGLAAILLPFDVGVRRLALGQRDLERAWAWIVEHHLLRRRPRRLAEAPSPVGRLFQAKSRAGERRAAASTVTEVASPPVEPLPASAPPSRPAEHALPAPPLAGEETLAGRLLRRKRGRKENGGSVD